MRPGLLCSYYAYREISSASMMSTVFPDLRGPSGVPEYRYEPLIAADAVRVLVVHPAERLDDPLHCAIVQYTHSADNYCNGRQYSAVSYTWGFDLFSHQLLIVGPLVSGTIAATSAYHCLKITANVDSLVRHLRRAHKPVFLWIDAVCLNQKDEEEKAQQIPKMGDIYSAAKKVHIWLGNDNIDDARRAFSIIWQVELRKEWDPSQDEVSLLAKFFGREWFARRWIIQEAVLAREARLHCGSYSLALSWVLLALKKIQLSAAGLDALGYGAKMLLYSIGKYQEAPGDCSLLTLLRDLHLSECSDPRDRVAALYGLASDSTRPSDLRGYNEGATQLYLNCASCFINSNAMSSNTLILHLAEFGSLPENSQRREPLSWVPDWSRNPRPLLDWFNGSQAVFEALHGTMWPQGEKATVLPSATLLLSRHFPRSYSGRNYSGFVDYCKKFIHPTHMSAQGNILRIHSHPLLYSMHGGFAEQVFSCESSDWKDVWSLFRQMANELDKQQKGEDQHPLLRILLAVVHKDRRGKEVRLSDLQSLIYSSRLSHAPSEEDVEFLEEIGFILSSYSLIRTSKCLEPDAEHPPFYHLGPRDAAVDDFLVPFMITRPENHPFTSEGFWAVFMCLRPTLRVDKKTSRDKDSPLTPFWSTVRWVGLTFNNMQFPHGRPLNEPAVFWLGHRAYCDAIESGLPGPYVFDVI